MRLWKESADRQEKQYMSKSSLTEMNQQRRAQLGNSYDVLKYNKKSNQNSSGNPAFLDSTR